MIFFDLDNTLLDHKESERLAVKSFHEENNNTFDINTDDFYRLWTQISNKHFQKFLNNELSFEQQGIERIKEIFASFKEKLADSDAQKFFQSYLFYYESNWKPFNDVISCLQYLKNNNKRLGIITNGDSNQQRLKLKKMGIYDYFNLIITASEVKIAKPHKEIFEIACIRANEKPTNCYYIGDDLKIDILSCIQTGMKGIWLNRKKINKCYLNMIYTLDDLTKYI